jgi:hypothetical protein
MMSKHIVNITSLSDLRSEERRVRMRIKKQEAELLVRMKQLPEEVITTAAVKLVSAVMQGNALKTLVNFAKKVGKNVLSSLFKDFV